MQPYQPADDDVANEMNLYGNADDQVDDNEMDDMSENKQPKKQQKSEKEEIVRKYIYFDIETTQERVIRQTNYGEHLLHEPNLCVAMVACDDCYERDVDEKCGRCGERKHIFIGKNCVDQFCKFLFAKNMENSIALAHNFRGFDGNFILQYIFKEGLKPKKIICNGK